MDTTANDRQVFDYFLIVGAPNGRSAANGDGREPQLMQVQGYGYAEGADDDDLVLSPVIADYPGDDRMVFDYKGAQGTNQTSFSSLSLLPEKGNGQFVRSPFASPLPVGWTLGSARDPIVDLAVINRTEGEQVPAGFVCIEKTVGGHAADLNAGSISAPSMFLCYRRGRDQPPLIYIDFFSEGQDNLSEVPAMVVLTQTREGRSANVNNTSSRPIYIMFGRAKAETYNPNELVVSDLCVINASRGEVAPHTYFNIQKNLNTSFVGSTLYLAFRKALCKRNYFTYKPEILSSFPNEYLTNSSVDGDFQPPSIPLPQEVPLFCLPLGATLESWPRRARMWSGTSKFVLTLSQESVANHLPEKAAEAGKVDGDGEVPVNSVAKMPKSNRAATNKARPVQKLYGTVKIFYEAVPSGELSAEQIRLLTYNAFPWLPENVNYSAHLRESVPSATYLSDSLSAATHADDIQLRSMGESASGRSLHFPGDSLDPMHPDIVNNAVDDRVSSKDVVFVSRDDADEVADRGLKHRRISSSSSSHPDPMQGRPERRVSSEDADKGDACPVIPFDDTGGLRFWRARALCLLSRWPMFDAHTSLLKHIAEMTSSIPPRVYPCLMERYLAYFYCRIPFPTPQRPRVLLQLGFNTSTPSDGTVQCISITIPTQASALPLSGCSLTQLVHVLSAQTIVRVMLYALLEQKIVLHSLRPDILTIIAESISAVLFPFIWQCPYVPLCPLTLAHILHAPVPFIIGIDSRYFDLYRAADDIIAVDLDTESIRFPTSSDITASDAVVGSNSRSALAVGGAAEHFLGSLSAVSGGGGSGKETKSAAGLSAFGGSRSGSGDGGGVVHNPSPKLALRILPQKPLKHLLKKLQEIQQKLKQELANNNKLLAAAHRRSDDGAVAGNSNTELLELSHAIRMRRNQTECELRECFLRFMAHLLKGYRQYLRPMQMSTASNLSNAGVSRHDIIRHNSVANRNATDTTSLFDVQAFLSSRERAYQPFYEQLVKTQHFCRFIEERSIMSDEEASQAMAFFDQCLDVVEQQGGSDQSSVRLISMDIVHDRTAFIPPPETAVPADAESRRALFDAELQAAETNDAVQVVRSDNSVVQFQYNRLPKLDNQLLLLEIINLTKSAQNVLPAELNHRQSLWQSSSLLRSRKLSTHSLENGFASQRTVLPKNSTELSTTTIAPSTPNAVAYHSKGPVLHKSHTVASPLVEHVRDELLDGITIRTQYELKAAQVLHENLRRLYYNANVSTGQSPGAYTATPSSGSTGAKEWATLLLTSCYTLWFMYTPAYAAVLEHVESDVVDVINSGGTETKDAVQFAYNTLIRMMEAHLLTSATVNLPTSTTSNSSQVTVTADQVCYRIVMYLCFRYGLDRLAYQLLTQDMQKRFNIQPNAVTYGYYNKTVYENSQKNRQNFYVRENAENKLRIEQESQLSKAFSSLHAAGSKLARARWTRLRNVIDAAWLFRLGGKEQFRLRQRKILLQSVDEKFVCRKFELEASKNAVTKTTAHQQSASSVVDRQRRSSATADSAVVLHDHQKRLEQINFSESDKFRSRIGSIVRHSPALHAIRNRPTSGITPSHAKPLLPAKENLTGATICAPSVQFVSSAGILFDGGISMPFVPSNSCSFAARRRRMSSFAAASFYSPATGQPPVVADGWIRGSRAATLSGTRRNDVSATGTTAGLLSRQRSIKHRHTFSRLLTNAESRSMRKHLNTFSCDAGVQSLSALLSARSAAADRCRQAQRSVDASKVAALTHPEDNDAEDGIDILPIPAVPTKLDDNEAIAAATQTLPASINALLADNNDKRNTETVTKTAEIFPDEAPSRPNADTVIIPPLHVLRDSVPLATLPAVPSAASPTQPPSLFGKLNSFFVKSSKSYTSFRKFIPNSVVSAITAVGTISDDEDDNGTPRRLPGQHHNYSSTTVKAPLPQAAQHQQRSYSIAEETRHSVISATTVTSNNKSISVTASPAVVMQQRKPDGGVNFVNSASSFTSPEKMQLVRSTLNDSLDTAAAAAAAVTSVVGKKLAELGSALSAGSAGMAYYGDTPSAAGYHFHNTFDNNSGHDFASATTATTVGGSRSSLSSSSLSRDVKKLRGGGGEQESVNFTSTISVQHVKNDTLSTSANDYSYSESLPSPSHSSFLRHLAANNTPQTLRDRNSSIVQEKSFSVSDNYSTNSRKSDDSESITSEEQQKIDANSRKTPTSFKKLLFLKPSSTGMRRAVSGVSLGVASAASVGTGGVEDENLNFPEPQLNFLSTPSDNNGYHLPATVVVPSESIVNVELCTTNQCEKCFSLLYDEEIMSNWQPDESNLNTVCTHCSHVFVPTLHISVVCANMAKFRRLKRSFAAAVDGEKWRGFREVLGLSTEISSGIKPDEFHVSESGNGEADSSCDQCDEDEERFCVQYLSPLVLRKELESVFAREGELCLSWQPRPSSTSSSFVAEHAAVYWNLLFYFERLKLPHFLGALLFVTWLQKRVSVDELPTELPHQIFLQKFIPELSQCVQVSLLWDDAGVYYTSTAAAIDDQSASRRQMLPLYCEDLPQQQGNDEDCFGEKSSAVALRLSALQLEESSSVSSTAAGTSSNVGKNVLNDILLSIAYQNDLLTPMKILLLRRLQQNVAYSHINDGGVVVAQQQHISLYRNLLFLLMCHLGRENISKTQFDREYRKAYQFLLRTSGEENDGEESLAALLIPSDKPPSTRAVWCELIFSMFRDLEL